jgi:hypothetical protein
MKRQVQAVSEVRPKDTHPGAIIARRCARRADRAGDRRHSDGKPLPWLLRRGLVRQLRDAAVILTQRLALCQKTLLKSGCKTSMKTGFRSADEHSNR